MSHCLTQLYAAALASVSSPPPLGEDGLYDIVEVAPYAFPWMLLWSGIATVVALLVIALAVLWFMRRTTRTQTESPHAKALRRLREVEASLNATEPSRTSLALSELLKDYLAERFRDSLRYETTPEFLRRISRESIKLPVAAQQDLSHFLTSADEIKFGNVPAAPSDIIDLHHLAARIINLCQTVGDDSNRRATEPDLFRN